MNEKKKRDRILYRRASRGVEDGIASRVPKVALRVLFFPVYEYPNDRLARTGDGGILRRDVPGTPLVTCDGQDARDSGTLYSSKYGGAAKQEMMLAMRITTSSPNETSVQESSIQYCTAVCREFP